MIDVIFTLDYEIYGNGAGTLRDSVYEPAGRLRQIFRKANVRFVAFVEVAEFAKIEAYAADPAIGLVKNQIRDLYREGFEIGLHLHPQWHNATYERGHWHLDQSEYNLCKLSRPRIAEIVGHSLDYMRHVVDHSTFKPLSFRAGNWLFQPTPTAASVLAENGIKIDSSVFKGGIQRNHGLDYRSACRNGYYWSFKTHVTEPDPTGPWIEIPIYTEMVPVWKMATAKRMGYGNVFGAGDRRFGRRVNRMLDFLRFRYPMKLDFCRMTLDEMRSMLYGVIREDLRDPTSYKPIVAIGHTKDFIDCDALDALLSFLKKNQIPVATFEDIYRKLLQHLTQTTCGISPHAACSEVSNTKQQPAGT